MLYKDPSGKKEKARELARLTWLRYKERHPDRVRESQRKSSKKQWAEFRAYINSYRLSAGCSVCGYNRSASALDFHHTSGDKNGHVSQFNSVKKAKREIALGKCIVICKNCHAELHSKLKGTIE